MRHYFVGQIIAVFSILLGIAGICQNIDTPKELPLMVFMLVWGILALCMCLLPRFRRQRNLKDMSFLLWLSGIFSVYCLWWLLPLGLILPTKGYSVLLKVVKVLFVIECIAIGIAFAFVIISRLIGA